MNDYEIKTVPFMGDELMAARDASGQIWAGVSYICNGIGLSKNQKDRQIRNVKADRVLSKGCGKFAAGVFDPDNEAIGMKLDFVPLWLAKINITPTMEQETPDVADKLEQYQLKAKDVLAAAFVKPTVPTVSANELVLMIAQNAVEMEKDIKALQAQTATLTERTEEIAEQTTALSAKMDNAARTLNRPNTIGEWKVDMELAMRELSPSIAYRGRLYATLETRAGCSLDARLTRLRNRAHKNGMTKAQAKSYTKLDIIANDRRLRSIFEAIIREKQAAAALCGEQTVIDAEFTVTEEAG